jgi:hypothetical protein
LVERLSGRLAEQVPERDVYGRGGAHLHPRAAEAEVLILQCPSMPVHLQGGLTEQERRHCLMDLRLDRAGTKERLAQADQSLFGMDMEPEQVGELAESDRLETCDLHRACPRRAARSRRWITAR